jgi:hypothetical protein
MLYSIMADIASAETKRVSALSKPHKDIKRADIIAVFLIIFLINSKAGILDGNRLLWIK